MPRFVGFTGLFFAADRGYSMSSLDPLVKYAESLQAKVSVNEPMSKHTTFKIGGPADVFIVPRDVQSMAKLCSFCASNSIKYLVVGNGSNLLVSDKGIRGAVIKSGERGEIEVDGEKITASAGANLSLVCEAARKNNLTGLEFAYGIPGSVGGAVYMNAGAYGGEIKDVVTKTYHIDGSDEGGFCGSELDFGYRHSAYTGTKMAITKVEFTLKKGDYDAINNRMTELITRRRTKQPLEYPSAGSVFKRPVGYYAGALIEECGLKGTQIGGAMVSVKHAGFIINAGGATCEDVLSLVDKIKSTVMKQKGVELECEIKAVGE